MRRFRAGEFFKSHTFRKCPRVFRLQLLVKKEKNRHKTDLRVKTCFNLQGDPPGINETYMEENPS